jgi:hypothetical protein
MFASDMRGRAGTLLCFVLLFILALSGTASAGYARQGDDFSYTFDGNTRVAVCDAERDATRVYSGYRRYGSGNTNRVFDVNGSRAGCTGGNDGRVGIYKHTTCEDRRFLPDPCGASYHG